MNEIKAPILLYHGVRECRDEGIRDSIYALSWDTIKGHISWLKRKGYSAVSLGELLSAPPASDRAFVITVDDGLESSYTHLFPLFRETGFTCVFFPVVGMVGAAGWVSWRQLKEMVSAGMEIGSHTLTHANLAAARSNELLRELADSRKRLEDGLGTGIRYLSLPGGYCSRRVREAAAMAGYEAICSSVFGYNRTPPARYRLRRFCLKAGDGVSFVRSIMGRDRLALLPRYLRERGVSACRSLLGERAYSLIRAKLLPAGAQKELPRFPSAREG